MHLPLVLETNPASSGVGAVGSPPAKAQVLGLQAMATSRLSPRKGDPADCISLAPWVGKASLKST